MSSIYHKSVSNKFPSASPPPPPRSPPCRLGAIFSTYVVASLFAIRCASLRQQKPAAYASKPASWGDSSPGKQAGLRTHGHGQRGRADLFRTGQKKMHEYIRQNNYLIATVPLNSKKRHKRVSTQLRDQAISYSVFMEVRKLPQLNSTNQPLS